MYHDNPPTRYKQVHGELYVWDEKFSFRNYGYPGAIYVFYAFELDDLDFVVSVPRDRFKIDMYIDRDEFAAYFKNAPYENAKAACYDARRQSARKKVAPETMVLFM